MKNDGFDGQGTNCKKWSRFKYEFDFIKYKLFNFPSSISLNIQLYKSAMRYHSILIRLYSRVMYLIYNMI